MNASLFFLCALALPLSAAEPAPAEVPTYKPGIREVAPGVIEIGKLQLNKQARTVSFPAKVQLDKGPLEYLLTTTDGSTHETLFSTTVSPTDVHFAMLLIGAKGSGLATPAPGDVLRGQIHKEALRTAPRPKGDSITITAGWKDKDGKAQNVRVERWLRHPESKKVAADGPWIYTGSLFDAEGHFLAQTDNCHAALVIYPTALIANPRAGNDDDTAWEVNEAVVPPAETPITLTITIEPEKPTTDKK